MRTQVFRFTGAAALGLSLGAVPSPATAEVTRVVVEKREDVLGGKAFGDVGAYEKIAGKVHFAVDPKNPGPNEFNTVHSIAISKDGRVVVADRGHHRIQVFDTDGNFKYMFSTGMRSSPYYHIITDDQTLWVSDGGTQRFLKYDLDGNFKYGWGGPGKGLGQFAGPHQFTVDQDGNLYVAEVFNGRIVKFKPTAGADKMKMVGQEQRYKGGAAAGSK